MGTQKGSLFFLCLNPGKAGQIDNRPDFNRAKSRPRNARGNSNRLVEAGDVDKVITAQVLARLYERTIRNYGLALAHSDARCFAGGLKRRGIHVLAVRVNLIGETNGFVSHLSLLYLGHPGEVIFVVMNKQDVFHVFNDNSSAGVARKPQGNPVR
jgi:hypothetical protein